MFSLEEKPADKKSLRSLLIAKVINGDDYQQALQLGRLNNSINWLTILRLAFFSLAIGLFTFGIIFFFAYNWATMHKFTKFALVESLIGLVAIYFAFFSKSENAGKFSVFFIGLLIGPMFAVFGQVYQTGADSYQLFFAWAALMLPLAILTGFAPLYLAWLFIGQLCLHFYIDQALERPPNEMEPYLQWAITTLAWGVFEWASIKKLKSFKPRFYSRLLLTLSLACLTFMNIFFIFEDNSFQISPLLLILVLAAIVFLYHLKYFDLFMQAAACLSIIIIASCLVAEAVNDIEAFFIVSIVVIGLSTGSVFWLRYSTRINSNVV